ncbi:MAG: hypothetical protein NT005_02435 [Spirochaetes bacterium]|nr:hypothetical protein [Spirochaetota bacterium]
MKVRPFSRSRHAPSDPPEPWETPYTRQDGGAYFRELRTPHPFVPGRREELPAGAWEALAGPCGVEDLGQLFIIPSCVRMTGRRAESVMTPLRVAALGTRAVGLWTAEPTPGLRAAIGIDSLAYIEDIHILLYGKLTFFARDARISLRYNTVARRVLEPALIALRERVAGASAPMPPSDQPEPLPFKWRLIAGSPFSRLGEHVPAIYRFACGARASGGPRNRRRDHLLMLTPRELLSLRDPLDSVHSYGVDSHSIPRRGIEEALFGDGSLRLKVRGTTLELALDERLLEAARLWLSGRDPTRPPKSDLGFQL